MRKIRLIILFVCTVSICLAQEYNPHSTNPIRKTGVMFKKKVVKAVDLREPQNRSWMSRNNEITRYLIQSFRRREIKGYTNDSLVNELAIREFEEKMKIPGLDFILDTLEDDPFPPDLALTQDFKYGYNQLYQLELVEDLLFDKARSVMYHDLQSITIYIPADLPDNIRGIQDRLITFRYKDCVDLFKDDLDAVWFNGRNDREHVNYADAFELGLFHGYVVKVSNSEDAYIVDNYASQKEGVRASLMKEFELMEYEHNLWEQ